MTILALIYLIALIVATFFWLDLRPNRGLYLVALLLPLERIGVVTWQGVTLRPAQVVALLTLIIWFFLWLRKKINLRKNYLAGFLLLFLIFSFLSLANAINWQRSLQVWLFLAFTLAAGWLVSQLITEINQLKRLVIFLLVGAALTALFGLYQFGADLRGLPSAFTGLLPQYSREVLGFPRIQATALEPLYWGNYLLIPLALTLSLLFQEPRRERKNVYWLLFLLFVLNIFLTFSRGAWLAALLTIILILFFNYWQILKDKKVITILLILLLLMALSLTLNQSIKNFLGRTFSSTSYSERLTTYKFAWQLWQKHPLVGNGPGSFGPYFIFTSWPRQFLGWPIVNNITLEILAEEGLIGLGILLWLALWIILRTVKLIVSSPPGFLKNVLIALLAAFLGILLQYQTFSVLYLLPVWFLIGLIVSAQIITKKSFSESKL